jgi:hypothetical protein
MRLQRAPDFVVPVHCVLVTFLIVGVVVFDEVTVVGGSHTEQAVYPLVSASDKVVSIWLWLR